MTKNIEKAYLITAIAIIFFIAMASRYGSLKSQISSLKKTVKVLEKENTETMTRLSFCYSSNADQTQKATSCNLSLYDLRKWIRECDFTCKNKKGE
jgi:hypothetical protein